MKNIKRIAATAATAAVMAFGLTVPAAADATSTNTCSNSGVGAATCVSASTDNSTTYTVNGNCSGIINNSVTQRQSNDTDQTNVSGGAIGVGGNNSTNSNTNSTSQSQSAGVTFSPNCSTTNVTQQVAAASRAAARPQVVAPTGGVHAGAGGALAGQSSVPSIIGLAGSVGTAGIGLALRRKAQLEV